MNLAAVASPKCVRCSTRACKDAVLVPRNDAETKAADENRTLDRTMD